MKTYLALLAHNHYDLTHRRLYELMRHCVQDLETVFVINNGSTDDTHEGLQWWKNGNTQLKVKEIPLEDNLGFTLGANYGLRTIVHSVQPEDVIILMSNDVQISHNFIPQVNDIVSDKSLVGGKLLYGDTGWNKFGDKLFPYLEGWLLASTSVGWQTLGYFDPQYAPNDYEDIDLSTTAQKLGFELMPLNDPNIHHFGGGTLGYTPKRLEQTLANKTKFEAKWVK